MNMTEMTEMTHNSTISLHKRTEYTFVSKASDVSYLTKIVRITP